MLIYKDELSMLHKNIVSWQPLWCVLTVASCTNEDFDKGNNGPDVPEGLPVTLKLNIGHPRSPGGGNKILRQWRYFRCDQ